MGKRRQAGDVVRKKANAGFIGEPLVIRLVDIDPDYTGLPYEEWCLNNCGDPGCREWFNADVLDKDGKVVGNACHISECEMEDI